MSDDEDYARLSQKQLAERAQRAWFNAAQADPFLIWHLGQLAGVGQPIVAAGDTVTTAARAGKRELFDDVAFLAGVSPERVVVLEPEEEG